MTCVAYLAIGRFGAAGIPYAGIGGIALLWLRLQPDHGLLDTMFLVVTIWGTDIGAYLVGRVVGGAKLAPKISPGKTWSGAIGGLLIGGFAGALLAGGGHGIDFAALPAAFLLSFFAQGGRFAGECDQAQTGCEGFRAHHSGPWRVVRPVGWIFGRRTRGGDFGTQRTWRLAVMGVKSLSVLGLHWERRHTNP